jgi:hypothetical protein
MTESAVVDDITYKTGRFVFIKRDDDQLVCGEIKLILIHDCVSPFLITSLRSTRFRSDVGIYEICPTDIEADMWICVPISELLDLYPRNAYDNGFSSFLVLHHAV